MFANRQSDTSAQSHLRFLGECQAAQSCVSWTLFLLNSSVPLLVLSQTCFRYNQSAQVKTFKRYLGWPMKFEVHLQCGCFTQMSWTLLGQDPNAHTKECLFLWEDVNSLLLLFYIFAFFCLFYLLLFLPLSCLCRMGTTLGFAIPMWKQWITKLWKTKGKTKCNIFCFYISFLELLLSKILCLYIL